MTQNQNSPAARLQAAVSRADWCLFDVHDELRIAMRTADDVTRSLIRQTRKDMLVTIGALIDEVNGHLRRQEVR